MAIKTSLFTRALFGLCCNEKFIDFLTNDATFWSISRTVLSFKRVAWLLNEQSWLLSEPRNLGFDCLIFGSLMHCHLIITKVTGAENELSGRLTWKQFSNFSRYRDRTLYEIKTKSVFVPSSFAQNTGISFCHFPHFLSCSTIIKSYSLLTLLFLSPTRFSVTFLRYDELNHINVTFTQHDYSWTTWWIKAVRFRFFSFTFLYFKSSSFPRLFPNFSWKVLLRYFSSNVILNNLLLDWREIWASYYEN